MFVALPGPREAEARLRHSVETGERRAVLRAAAGLGKSVVLARVLEAVRGPGRRVSLVRGPEDASAMMAGLVEALGVRTAGVETRSALWRKLSEAVKLCGLQGLGVVLAVDAAEQMEEPGAIERLTHLEAGSGVRLTVLEVGREQDRDAGGDPWGLAIRLGPLTRSEAGFYVAEKLASAGRTEATFTPRALTRLHWLSEGVPRGLDRLASLALMAGAARGLEVIGPEVVEGVARDCVGV